VMIPATPHKSAATPTSRRDTCGFLFPNMIPPGFASRIGFDSTNRLVAAP
jgi:hypothetical protein